MSISDEAVKAMYEALPGWVAGYLDPETMRTALEAAAPHMMAGGAVAAVLGLHREMECRDEDNEPVGGSYCEECKDLDDHSGERVHEVYPCTTVREITKALAGEESFATMRDRIEAHARG